MSEADRARWNERYSAGDASQEPVARLVAQETHVRPAQPGARALDLACGAGRHALYLARLGYVVDAWDVSDAGLTLLAARAREAGIARQIHTRQIDLDTATLPAGAYDLVLDAYFLDRRLLPQLGAAVRPGGLLFMETLLSTPQKPGRPEFYLQPGELQRAFPGFTTIFSQESQEEGWAAWLGRRL